MAENKKSFVIYTDLLKSIEHLTNEEKGILFNHLLEYVNDKNPVLKDRLILTAWKPIELQLKRDLIKFEEVKAKRSDAGKRSAEIRALKAEEQNSTNPTHVKSVEQTSANPTVNDTVNVNDTVIKDINPNLSVDWEKLKDNFNSLTGKSTKVISNKVKGQINARLKEGYTKQDLWNAIVNCFNDPYHKENPKYLTLEFISRSDKMEKYSAEIKKQKIKEDRL